MVVRFRLGFASFEIRWWIVLVVALSLVLSFWLSEALLVCGAYLSLVLHEVGHAAVQRAIFGVRSVVRLFGVIRGRTTSTLSRLATPRERIIYSLTGPLVGIIFGLAVLLVAVVAALGWPFVAGGAAIMALHVYNLLPFKAGSDGAVIKQMLAKETP